jgi:hypothetical protein
MILHWNQRKTTVHILLDTGCTTPLINSAFVEKWKVPYLEHQRDNENHLHPVAFHSRKFTPAEINYKLLNKELLAIVNSFKYWRHYCEGTVHQVQVFSDHQNLEYFTPTKVLHRRQPRWVQELAGIDFKIFFRPGSERQARCTIQTLGESPYQRGE